MHGARDIASNRRDLRLNRWGMSCQNILKRISRAKYDQ